MMPEEIEPVMGLIFGEGDRKENGMLYRYHCKYVSPWVNKGK